MQFNDVALPFLTSFFGFLPFLSADLSLRFSPTNSVFLPLIAFRQMLCRLLNESNDPFDRVSPTSPVFPPCPFFNAAVNASNGIGYGSGRVGEGPLPSISIGDACVLPS